MTRSYFQYLRGLQEEFFRKNAEMVATPEEATRLFYQELEKDYISNIQDNPEIIYHDTAEFVSQMKMEGYKKFKSESSYTPKLQFDSLFLYLYRLTRIQYIAAKKYKLDTGELDELLLQRAAELNNNERPQGRTAEEIVKGILADIEALQANEAATPPAAPKRTQKENYDTIPFDLFQRPNDKITNNIATATPEEWGAGEIQVLEQQPRGRKPAIISTVNFDLDKMAELGVSKLDSFDLFVLHTCIAIKAGGNAKTTVNIIYRTMTGKDGKIKTSPTAKMKKSILESLEKLMYIPVTIDAEGICFEYGHKGKGKYTKRALLPAGIEGNRTINSAEVDDIIKFYDDSPLMEIAMMKNRQVITYEKKLLNVPLNTNRQNIVIPPYLIHRIKNSEHKEMRNTIIIDRIIKDNNWTGDRIRIVKVIEKCFDYWRDECKFISKYDIEKDGRGKAIKIHFTPVKK